MPNWHVLQLLGPLGRVIAGIEIAVPVIVACKGQKKIFEFRVTVWFCALKTLS